MSGTRFAKRIHEAVGLSPYDREALSSLRVIERTLELASLSRPGHHRSVPASAVGSISTSIPASRTRFRYPPSS
jgi:hypothetical protein